MVQWICKANRMSFTQWQNATPESRRALIAAYLQSLSREERNKSFDSLPVSDSQKIRFRNQFALQQ